MALPALKLPQEEPADLQLNIGEKTSSSRISETLSEEVIFALCRYLGSDINTVVEKLTEIMRDYYGYNCKVIRLSSLISANNEDVDPTYQGSTEYKRIKNLIKNGNKLREDYSNDVLAELAIKKIATDRVLEQEEGDRTNPNAFKPKRTCYIIHSLKNPKELELIKKVYRGLVYTIGIFSPYSIRKENLLRKDLIDKEIAELIDQDSHEEIPYGQDVRKTFTQSDYFLRVGNLSADAIKLRLERFIHLIFGTKIQTPTDHEIAMYAAASASANSSCLSRQVGASITDKHGSVLSHGWNDVPKHGGDLYLSEELGAQHDEHRCFGFYGGECQNDVFKKKIRDDLISKFIDAGVIEADKAEKALEILKDKKTKIGSITEYSRSVHAEMHAIIIGSQKTGDRMKGGRLYCTTYPCHNCARHIILAGIEEVYYIEPYSKSLATRLHSDSISETEDVDKKVKILLYDGVAPSRFMSLFAQISDRKDHNGKVINKPLKEAKPQFAETLYALATLESIAVKNIEHTDLKFSFDDKN